MELYVKNTLSVIMILLGTAVGQAQVTIGSDQDPLEGILLELKDTKTYTNGETADKGLLLPRVSLESLTSLKPLLSIDPATSAEKEKYTGTVVYNVRTNESLNMKEGKYYWDGARWAPMVVEFTQSVKKVQSVELSNSMTSTDGSPSGTGGNVLSFPTITIPEDGAYAFIFKLYGHPDWSSARAERYEMYLSLWVSGSLKDIVALSMFMGYDGNANYTHTATMAGNFKKGDIPTFKLAHIGGKSAWTLKAGTKPNPNRTTMSWWKL